MSIYCNHNRAGKQKFPKNKLSLLGCELHMHTCI